MFQAFWSIDIAKDKVGFCTCLAGLFTTLISLVRKKLTITSIEIPLQQTYLIPLLISANKRLFTLMIFKIDSLSVKLSKLKLSKISLLAQNQMLVNNNKPVFTDRGRLLFKPVCAGWLYLLQPQLHIKMLFVVNKRQSSSSMKRSMYHVWWYKFSDRD